MYSSLLGGIVTDPALVTVPFDDHMVHRGHGVFDTASLVEGRLYNANKHLDRLLRSAELARIELPFDKEHMIHVILQACAASKRQNASIR
jgi:4-amino-4-deoxychorismate lyase